MKLTVATKFVFVTFRYRSGRIEGACAPFIRRTMPSSLEASVVSTHDSVFSVRSILVFTVAFRGYWIVQKFKNRNTLIAMSKLSGRNHLSNIFALKVISYYVQLLFYSHFRNLYHQNGIVQTTHFHLMKLDLVWCCHITYCQLTMRFYFLRHEFQSSQPLDINVVL